MHKEYSKFLIILLIISLLFPISAAANEADEEVFVVENGVLIDYIGQEKNVTIPDSINGQEVVRISKDAFSENDSIESIIIPDTVKAIDAYAFYRCSNLVSVRLPNSIQIIDTWVFGYCSKMNSITIPENVTSIGSASFYRCESLGNVIIPDGVTSIGPHAFRGCSSIKEISIPRNLISIEYRTFSGCISLESIVFPDGLKTIEKEAFYQAGLKEIRIPQSIEIIEEKAFYGNEKLVTVEIEVGINAIESGVFEECPRLKHIYFCGSKEQWDEIELSNADNDVFRKIEYNYAGEDIETPNEQIIHDQEEMGEVSPTGFLEWCGLIAHKGISILVSLLSRISDFFSNIIKNIFFWNYFIMLVVGNLLLHNNIDQLTEERYKKRKLLFTLIACSMWVFISTFRANTVGADTQNYMYAFENHNAWSWKEVWNYFFHNLYRGGVSGTGNYEPGYILFEKLVGSIYYNETFYKFVVALIFMTCLGRFIYKYSSNPIISFVIYDALFYNMFSLTGYRQVIAVSISFLIGYDCIRERKLSRFIILLVFGILVHRATIVFVLFYVLANKKITIRYLFGSVVAVALMILLRSQLFSAMRVLMGYEQYTGTYGFVQQNFLILFILLTCFMFYMMPKAMQKCEYAEHYYNGLILMWVMMPYAMSNPTAMRLVYDFGFILLLSVPDLIRSSDIQNNKTIISGTIILMFLYFIVSRSPEYSFIWQV